VTTSSTYSTAYDGFKVYDKSFSSKWVSLGGNAEEYVELTMPTARQIHRVEWVNYSIYGEAPTKVRISSEHNGVVSYPTVGGVNGDIVSNAANTPINLEFAAPIVAEKLRFTAIESQFIYQGYMVEVTWFGYE
jgi:hypothetical protein